MATVEKLENKKMKLTVEIAPEEFDSALQKAYLKTKGRYNVPGFRKGKAPRKMIETMYGAGVFWEEAFDIVYPGAYEAAIKEHGLDPVERPDISIEKVGAGEGAVFTAEFAVRPEVQLGVYKGIEVAKKAYTVEDSAVDAILNRERERVARFVEQDRPVQQGDRVLLNYSGSVDGVKFEGGTAENATLDVGSGTFIPGFEEQLVGMQKEEEKAIEVTFPEEYHAEELKGKVAVFDIKINGIQEKELPALDDDFAQDISEFDTLDELKNSEKEKLLRQNEERAKNEMEEAAIRAAVENASIDVPGAMIERQLDYILQEMSYRLSMSGLNLETYCQYMGKSIEDIRGENREEAEYRVRMQLVLEEIAKVEAIEAADEDVEKEIARLAERAGMEPDKYKESIGESDLGYFKERCVTQKTIDFLLENAKLVEEKKKAPAKKKAAEMMEEVAEEASPAKKAPVKKKAAAAKIDGDSSEEKADKPEPEKKPRARKTAKPKEE